ncbi:12587_t:CDS:2 [Acaulospora morrowiae]|uniref:12587_t:CDS:1 n=1 Tax=Acaulospora morrowiae TaxID=94023 RepID=A0A9N8ZTC2_9GLOM|nr:12587_t:CDS:2 [Acaulospora morrowiae]
MLSGIERISRETIKSTNLPTMNDTTLMCAKRRKSIDIDYEYRKCSSILRKGGKKSCKENLYECKKENNARPLIYCYCTSLNAVSIGATEYRSFGKISLFAYANITTYNKRSKEKFGQTGHTPQKSSVIRASFRKFGNHFTQESEKSIRNL